MGNTSSTAISCPNTILECFDGEGNLCLERYCLYSRRQDEICSQELDHLIDSLATASTTEDATTTQSPKPKRQRSCFRKNVNIRRSDNGVELHTIDAKDCHWNTTYFENPATDDKKFVNKFRRRFRCSYDCFLLLLEHVKEAQEFERWQRKDAVGRSSSPIQLLVLGTLRYLGRGWTFDDLEEATSISEETFRQFFHVFIRWGSTVLYDKYVKYPKEEHEAAVHTQEMEQAGFSGCIASTDATHVCMLRCPSSRANENKGHKESLPARSYNISVNHRRQILHTTTGHPSRWNDKTLATFDKFLMSVKRGSILSTMKFSLYDKDIDGSVIKVQYNGCWILCDNGYQNWSCLMAPLKDPVTFQEARWSHWLESMRKDVECTFGIMKGRFRILKTGIRVHSIDAVDKIWSTCCALHNMFLEEDGLSENWEGSDLGSLSVDDFENCLVVPPNNELIHDHSGMGYGNDRHERQHCPVEAATDEEDDDTVEDNDANDLCDRENNIKHVSNISYIEFRNKLINHFDIMYQRREVKWPTRNGLQEVDF